MGTKNGRSKLTDAIVAECRDRHFGEPGETFSALAREFDVHRGVMRSAILGRTWGHVRSGELSQAIELVAEIEAEITPERRNPTERSQ